jgi:hypothetical protein
MRRCGQLDARVLADKELKLYKAASFCYKVDGETQMQPGAERHR